MGGLTSWLDCRRTVPMAVNVGLQIEILESIRDMKFIIHHKWRNSTRHPDPAARIDTSWHHNVFTTRSWYVLEHGLGVHPNTRKGKGPQHVNFWHVGAMHGVETGWLYFLRLVVLVRGIFVMIDTLKFLPGICIVEALSTLLWGWRAS
jgi:hypothetical protein